MKKALLLFNLLFVLFVVRAQQLIETEGVVRDSRHFPLAGASVMTEDGMRGTATDENGNFRLSVPVGTRNLLVSFIGMATQKVRLLDKLNIVLREAPDQLSEIIVVGYGQVAKSAFVGSASTVRTERLKERPVTVITNALEGLVAGVQTGEGSGQPGAGMRVRIRGFGSVNADNEPVYVVDGVIYRGELCDLNFADIESLTVLKDAAATALYGSSAGNGVVLITMKSAESGKPTITFGIRQGFSDRAIPEYDRIGLWEYYPLQWEMLRNAQISQGMSESAAAEAASAKVFSYLKYNPFSGIGNEEIVTTDGRLNPAATELLYGDDLDWEGALRRKGYRSEYNLSYGMKNLKGDLYASLGYLKENSYIIRSDFERFSARVSGNLQPVGWLRTGLSLNFIRSDFNMADTQDNASDPVNPFYFTRYIGPVYPIHQHDPVSGEYMTDGQGNRLYDYETALRGTKVPGLEKRNIVAETLNNRNFVERNGVNGRGYVELKLFKGLRAISHLTLDSYDVRQKKYDDQIAASSPGRLYATSSRSTTLLFNQLLDYELNFGKGEEHRIHVLAGHESYSYQFESLYGNKQDQILENIYDMSNFLTMGRMLSYTDAYHKEGYFVQATCDYEQTYHFSASYRRDGTSRFSPDNRWGNFWSVGAAWSVDREKWMRNAEWVDRLRFRVSYGQTGNDNVLQPTSLPNTFTSDYYPYQTLYNIGANNALESGIAFSRFGNAGLKWETQTSFDVAAEFGLSGWLSGSVEYFRKDSRNLLFNVPQVLSSGTSSIWQNVGSISNRGVELTLDFQVIRSAVWKWNLGVNATFLKNEIRKMPGSQPEIIDGVRKLKVGESLYNFWLAEYRGVNPENGDAQYTFDGGKYKWNSKVCYVNAQGDSLTSYSGYAKYHYAGSPVPKVYGGISTSLSYKSVELSAVLSYSVGGKVYNTGYQVLMYNGKYGQAFHRDIRRRWQKPGDVTDVPRLDDSEASSKRTGLYTADQTNATSDRWLADAGYLNVKSVILKYRLPRILLSRYGIGETDVFVSGENLFLLTAMKGLDPRQMFKGVISVANPAARVFTLGLNVTL